MKASQQSSGTPSVRAPATTKARQGTVRSTVSIQRPPLRGLKKKFIASARRLLWDAVLHRLAGVWCPSALHLTLALGVLRVGGLGMRQHCFGSRFPLRRRVKAGWMLCCSLVFFFTAFCLLLFPVFPPVCRPWYGFYHGVET